MARISVAEREANKAKYDEVVVELFFEYGWDQLTYDLVFTHLQKKYAMKRKSTLQNYYPDKKAFGHALRGKVFPQIVSLLDFSSREAFITSWTQGLEHKKFRYVMSLLIINATSDDVNEMAIAGMDRLIGLVTEQLGEQAYQDIEMLLGRTILRLMER